MEYWKKYSRGHPIEYLKVFPRESPMKKAASQVIEGRFDCDQFPPQVAYVRQVPKKDKERKICQLKKPNERAKRKHPNQEMEAFERAEWKQSWGRQGSHKKGILNSKE